MPSNLGKFNDLSEKQKEKTNRHVKHVIFTVNVEKVSGLFTAATTPKITGTWLATRPSI